MLPMVNAKLRTFSQLMLSPEPVDVPGVLDEMSEVVAIMVRENLLLLAEDTSWIPQETRVGDDFLEVKICISLDQLEARLAARQAKERERFETARRQAPSLLED